jgi:dihydrolipoamide dehydrogenase
LYRNAEIFNILKKSEVYGIYIQKCIINVDKIQERKQGIVDKLVKGLEQLLKLIM